jgi:hypothetical protein
MHDLDWFSYPTRRANCHHCGGSSGLCRRSSVSWCCGAARDALRVVIVLVLALVARHTSRGASEPVAATLRISRAVGCDSGCHQGREDDRVTSHGKSLWDAEKNSSETVKRTKRD